MQIKDLKQYSILVLFLISCQRHPPVKDGKAETADKVEKGKTADSTEKKIEQINQGVKALDQKLKQVEVSQNAEKNETKTQLAGINESVIKNQKTANGLGEGLKTLNNNALVLRQEVQEAKGKADSQLVRLNSNLESMNSNITQLKGEVVSINPRLDEMTADQKEIKANALRAAQMSEQLFSRIDILDGRVGNIEQQILQMTANLTNLGQELSSYTASNLVKTNIPASGASMDSKQFVSPSSISDQTENKDSSSKIVAMKNEEALGKVTAAKTLPEKIMAANDYYQNIWAQYQINDNMDQETYDKLAKAALVKVFKDLRSLNASVDQPKKENDTLTGTNENVEALMVSMPHKIYRDGDSEEVSTLNELKPSVPILNLILDEFEFSKDPEATQTVLSPLVLSEKEFIIQMLKIRLNTYVKLALGRLSDQFKDNSMGPFKEFRLPDLSVNLTDEKLGLLKDVRAYLLNAVITNENLNHLGNKSNLTTPIEAGLSNLKPSADADKVSDETIKSLVLDIFNAQKTLLPLKPEEPKPATSKTDAVKTDAAKEDSAPSK